MHRIGPYAPHRIGLYASVCKWETTFPRNIHAVLGKPIDEENILPSMHETSLSPCPIRRGYFSEMLFPTWLGSHKLVSWTNTSSCYHHLASWTDTPAYHGSHAPWHARSVTRLVRWYSTDTSSCYHHRVIVCLEVELEKHIVMLSSSCDSTFMLPKLSFGKAEPRFQSVFSKHFSALCIPNRVLTPLKSASKTHSEMLVRPSKIFVWGA